MSRTQYTDTFLRTDDRAQLPVRYLMGRGTTAVVIVPSAFGVTPDLVSQMTELIGAGAGLVASYDPFVRGDKGVADYADMKRVFARIGAFDAARGYADLRTVIAWARKPPVPMQPFARVVAVGICFGGPYAVHAAADGLVDGVVTWHGTRIEQHLDWLAQVRCPLRMHVGDADPVIPAAAIEALRGAAAALPDAEVIVHPGATHGFTHRYAQAYSEPAEQAAMASVKALL